MGKVECTGKDEADLCTKMDGYPTIHVYEDGEMKEDLDLRTFDLLLEKVKALVQKAKAKSKGPFAALQEISDLESKPNDNINKEGKAVELTDAVFKQVIFFDFETLISQLM